jgi:hypothetical protein
MPAINQEYLYDEDDISKILKSNLIEQLKKDPKFKEVHVLPVVRSLDDHGHKSLGYVLNTEKSQHSGARTILIPCNLNSTQWVGILIEFSAENKVTRALYLDPVKKALGAEGRIDEKVVSQYKAVYPETEFIQLSAHRCVTSRNIQDSGTLTVYNLIQYTSKLKISAAQVITIKNLRNEDAKLLMLHQAEAHQVFVDKQSQPLTCINEAVQAKDYQGFKYNASDIMFALHSRLNDVRSQIEKIWDILGPADDTNLDKLLLASLENKKITNKARYLIIPCHSSGCWFGVFIKIDANNNVEDALFYDSRRNEASSPYPALCLQLKKVFPGSILRMTSCLKQDDIESTGQFVIENLVETATGKVFPTARMINNIHLHSVQLHNQVYAATFESRQNFSEERFPRAHDESFAEPSKDKDALFKTLLLLNFLFNELSKPQTKTSNYQETRDCIINNYATAKNSQNQLYMQFTPKQLTATETVHALVPQNAQLQIEVKQNLTDFGTLSTPVGYARPDAAVVVGGGTVAAAAVITDVIAAAEIGAIVLNPLFIVPVVLVGAYGATSYSLSNRNAKIALAFNEYLQAEGTDNLDKFEEIKEKLKDELYGIGKEPTNIISRNIRHGRSSYKQLAFTYLLLGITKAINGDEDTYDTLHLAFRYASLPEYGEYRKLALLWMIHILTPKASGNPANIQAEQQKVLLAKYLQNLKKENPNIEAEIQEYISATIRLVLNYVRLEDSYSDIDTLKTQLRKIINFGPIHALRHFESHGRINELVLTFIQVICMKKTFSSRKKPNFDELISDLDLQGVENNVDIEDIIAQELQKYARIYFVNDTQEHDITSTKAYDTTSSLRSRNLQQRIKI